ncbi:DUF3500 domain-containing protein [Streptomyces sp. NPDC001401]|uniref:DUF3500 domain-containing protein n=1 Tax=Streptomyces sp. NPDC001401 TaxID=3364570 RepID=UPI0036B1F171
MTAPYEAPDTIKRMLFATWALLNSLTPEQRAIASYPMSDPRRLDWDFIPKPDRTGIAMSALHGHQRTLAQHLLASGLSTRGYSQALQIMAMENMLREKEVHERGLGVIAGDFRDPDNYSFSFFGRPGFEDTWGWRVLGHHLSLSYTIIGQRYLTVTPCNMGAQPVPSGVFHPLRDDEELAFELLHGMSDAHRKATVIHDVAPADYVTRQVPRIGRVELPDHVDLGIPSYRISDADREALKFEADRPRGVAACDLDSRGATLVKDLIRTYVGRIPDELADTYLRMLDATNDDKIFFCWAGGTEHGTSHYYRIQTDTLLIEFDNAIDSGNHIHSVWRDYRNDLGHTLLIDHYEQSKNSDHHLSRRTRSTVPAEG